MKRLFYLIQKEFIQIRRNRTLLPIIFIMPLVQLLILVYAADLNLKSIVFSIYDQDATQLSRDLQSKYMNSPFFEFNEAVHSDFESDKLLRQGETDIIISIPDGFEEAVLSGQQVSVQFLTDGINSAAAVLVSAYASNILNEFSMEAYSETLDPQITVNYKRIGMSYRHWYNPELDFKIYMVPGILVLLVSLIGWILTALNIVREKELGTIEQINVSPISRIQLVMGKLLPFWIIAMMELAFGLIIGKFLFGVPLLGSLGVLFLFTSVYLVVPLGFGLMISAISQTQLQVMFLSFFFNLTFILMSGLFTPAESMPDWANTVNYLNPMAYFMRVIRMILLKGANFSDILPDFIGILIYSLIVVSIAILAYRKKN